MKMLIFCPAIDDSPFGKVCFGIIDMLIRNDHDITLIVSASKLQGVKRFYETGYGYVYPERISKIITILFHQNIKYYLYGKKILGVIARNNIVNSFRPDIIFALCSRDFDILMTVAMKISKKYKIPYAIHLVDPIPPPKGWETYEIYRKSLVYIVKKQIQHCDLFSMSNEHMLKFQQENIDFNIRNKSFVIPDPISDKFNWYGEKIGVKKVIVYLGSFYSARKPDALINGFALFALEDKVTELHIVGYNKINLDDYKITTTVKSRIKLLSWVSEVDKIIENADLLVDVDADIEGDVFVSSKLKKYLSTDRMILSITRNNSPSYCLLSSLKESVYISSHDPSEVSVAISKALNIKYFPSVFHERYILFEKFSVSAVVKKVEDVFSSLIKDI